MNTVQAQAASLTVTVDSLQLPDVSQGDTARQSFWVINTFADSLRIRYVNLEGLPVYARGQSGAAFPNERIAPGDSQLVWVHVATAQLAGVQGGPISLLGQAGTQYATWQSTWRVKVLPAASGGTFALYGHPATYSISQTLPGQAKGGFLVWNPGDDTLTLRNVKGSCSCLQITTPDVDVPPGDTLELAYYLTGAEGWGEKMRSIRFRTNAANVPGGAGQVPVRIRTFPAATPPHTHAPDRTNGPD